MLVRRLGIQFCEGYHDGGGPFRTKSVVGAAQEIKERCAYLLEWLHRAGTSPTPNLPENVLTR